MLHELLSYKMLFCVPCIISTLSFPSFKIKQIFLYFNLLGYFPIEWFSADLYQIYSKITNLQQILDS